MSPRPSPRTLAVALLAALLLVASSARAQVEVVGPRVRVVVPDAELAPYARGVAARAERAVAAVDEAFGVRLPPLVITVDPRHDVLNAVAMPVPRPTVAMRARFPLRGELGLAAPDPLLTLLVHEVAHLGHLTARGGSQPLRLGIVGEALPLPPPAWLLEGLAVWAESRLAPGGGRLDDARVRGVLRTLAADGPWPSLAEASTITHDAWPGGETRYLLGGAFVERLVRDHGTGTLLDALRAFEAGPPHLGFADAWRRVTGRDLAAAWRGLREDLREEAERLAEAARPLEALGVGPGRLHGPARSPDGTRVAWIEDGSLRVAAWRPDGLGDGRVLRRGVAAGRPAWWDGQRLVYARIDRRPAGQVSELFALDLADGAERRLTRDGRAFLPTPLPDGCLLYVRDAEPDGSSLRRWCDGDPPRDEAVAAAPDGSRLLGLAASPGGRVAAIVWRDGRSDPALLDPAGGWRLLLDDAAREMEPTWDGEDALLVRSDRAGPTVEAYRLELDGARVARLERLTRTVGGVHGPAPGVAVRVDGDGERLVRLPEEGTASRRGGQEARGQGDGAANAPQRRPAGAGSSALGFEMDGDTEDRTPAEGPVPSLTVRSYDPWRDLAPYGWLPNATLSLRPLGGSLSATLHGRDALSDHAWEATAGVSLHERGPLGPAILAARYRYRPQDTFATVRRPRPFTGSLEVAVRPYAPHRGASLGLRPRLEAHGRWTVSRDPFLALEARAGLMQLPGSAWGPRIALGAGASRAFVDAWGVPTDGWTASATVLQDPAPGGPSRAAWVAGRLWAPGPLRTTWEVGARAGWRPSAPVPTERWGDTAASFSVGVSHPFEVNARLGDGRWSLERVRLAPRARLLGSERAVLLAADATVAADVVLNYLAPASLQLQGGWADGPWLRAGIALLP